MMETCAWCGRKCLKPSEYKGKSYHDNCLDRRESLDAFDELRKKENAIAEEHRYVKPTERPRQHHSAPEGRFIEDTSNTWRDRSKESVERILAKGSLRR